MSSDAEKQAALDSLLAQPANVPVHLISTPYTVEVGRDKAAETKADNHNPPHMYCYNPNTDAPQDEGGGWLNSWIKVCKHTKKTHGTVFVVYNRDKNAKFGDGKYKGWFDGQAQGGEVELAETLDCTISWIGYSASPGSPVGGLRSRPWLGGCGVDHGRPCDWGAAEYSINGQEGVVWTLSELKSLLAESEITASTEIWTETLGEVWTPLGQFIAQYCPDAAVEPEEGVPPSDWAEEGAETQEAEDTAANEEQTNTNTPAWLQDFLRTPEAVRAVAATAFGQGVQVTSLKALGKAYTSVPKHDAGHLENELWTALVRSEAAAEQKIEFKNLMSKLKVFAEIAPGGHLDRDRCRTSHYSTRDDVRVRNTEGSRDWPRLNQQYAFDIVDADGDGTIDFAEFFMRTVIAVYPYPLMVYNNSVEILTSNELEISDLEELESVDDAQELCDQAGIAAPEAAGLDELRHLLLTHYSHMEVVSKEHAQNLISQGVLTDSTLCWYGDLGNWTPWADCILEPKFGFVKVPPSPPRVSPPPVAQHTEPGAEETQQPDERAEEGAETLIMQEPVFTPTTSSFDPVGNWLAGIGGAALVEYLPALKAGGYDQLTFLSDADQGDMQEFVDGLVIKRRMKKPHAKALLKAWRALKKGSELQEAGDTGADMGEQVWEEPEPQELELQIYPVLIFGRHTHNSDAKEFSDFIETLDRAGVAQELCTAGITVSEDAELDEMKLQLLAQYSHTKVASKEHAQELIEAGTLQDNTMCWFEHHHVTTWRPWAECIAMEPLLGFWDPPEDGIPPFYVPSSFHQNWSRIDNISRMTGEEMSVAVAGVNNGIRKDEALVAHFTSLSVANLIIADDSPGFLASTGGQGGGGFSVVFAEDPMAELDWAKYQGGKFRRTTGKKLWGEKADRVLMGGPDAEKLDAVFFISVPKIWMENAIEVDGRPLIRIVPPVLLTDKKYCGKDRIQKLCILKRGVEVLEELEPEALQPEPEALQEAEPALKLKVQPSGKGKFHPVQFTLTGTKLMMGPIELDIGRLVDVKGCKIKAHEHKGKKKKREHTFRMDLAAADSFGDTHYIIDARTPQMQKKWISALERAEELDYVSLQSPWFDKTDPQPTAVFEETEKSRTRRAVLENQRPYKLKQLCKDKLGPETFRDPVTGATLKIEELQGKQFIDALLVCEFGAGKEAAQSMIQELIRSKSSGRTPACQRSDV